MPTENRSTMVSVPRELTPEMREAYEANSLAPVGPISRTGYLAMLDAAPADQHQGEPVALPARKAHKKGNSPMQNAKNSAWNACLDEIAKLGPLYAHPAPAVQQQPVPPYRFIVRSTGGGPNSCEVSKAHESLWQSEEHARRVRAATEVGQIDRGPVV